MDNSYQKVSPLFSVDIYQNVTSRLKIEEKRKEIESKIQLDMKQVRVNCKICGNKVAMEVIVEHSKNCREKMEQSRKLREINKLIHEDGFEALKLYRELHTKNVLAK